MRNTVFGILCDSDGLAWDEVLEQGPSRPEARMRAWATPSSAVATRQRELIRIDLDHDGRAVGELVHLERDRHGRLWAVGHVAPHVRPAVTVAVGSDSVEVETPLYFSAERIGGTPDFPEIEILSVALTSNPARVAAHPVTFLSGELSYRGAAEQHAWNLEKRLRARRALEASCVHAL